MDLTDDLMVGAQHASCVLREPETRMKGKIEKLIPALKEPAKHESRIVAYVPNSQDHIPNLLCRSSGFSTSKKVSLDCCWASSDVMMVRTRNLLRRLPK